ncbi:DUF6064 family protein [Arsukibacterium sp.]|uniref:DUF6064 family protein n=1 Tax=Arsukibacterium sp. TaxID=1977258 RepID=UPI003566C3CB
MSVGVGYQLQQFIPFSSEVYLRLLERIGETFWPWHIVTLAMGVAAVLLALKNHGRATCLLTGLLWVVVGYGFFIQYYAELNWAGDYIGFAFIAQGALLLFVSFSGTGLAKTAPAKRPSVIFGLILTLIGLLGWPFIGLLTGNSSYQAAVFGIYADPTALTTLGLALIMLRGWPLWLSVIIPLLWLLVSSLTWWVLQTL